MWNRQELKARGKAAFKANYWRCVLVALILVAIVGGGSASGRSSGHSDNNDYGVYSDGTIHIGGTTIHYNTPEQFSEAFHEALEEARPALPVISAALGFAALLGLAVKLLLVNPLEVGCCNFFRRNADQSAPLDEIARGFKPSWINNVVTLLLRDIFIALWSLLLIVPGIIKLYSYRMTPYIMADHPEMSGTEAITLSKQMMKGQKWSAFVFDLSFIGWYLLDVLTAGILGIFYVHPYKAAADAELYLAISEGFFDGGSASTTLPEF